MELVKMRSDRCRVGPASSRTDVLEEVEIWTQRHKHRENVMQSRRQRSGWCVYKLPSVGHSNKLPEAREAWNRPSLVHLRRSQPADTMLSDFCLRDVTVNSAKSSTLWTIVTAALANDTVARPGGPILPTDRNGWRVSGLGEDGPRAWQLPRFQPNPYPSCSRFPLSGALKCP